MKESFKIIRKTNELRKVENPNLNELEVTHSAMAISQIRTAWSRFNRNGGVAHAPGNGVAMVAENLAWVPGSADRAVTEWYNEKVCVTNPNSDECYRVRQMKGHNPAQGITVTAEQATGHYKNLINADFLVVGAAVGDWRGQQAYAGTQGSVYIDKFNLDPQYQNWFYSDGSKPILFEDRDNRYSIDEYEAIFDAWRNGEEHYKDTKVILERPNQKNDEFTLIAGGASATNGIVVENNTLTITNNEKVREAFGGYQVANGNTINNTVNVESGATIYLIAGGQAQNGNANSNKVTLNGASATNVKGGFTTTGNANNNEITISGGNISGEIIAGQGSGSATGNKITINNNANISDTLHNR